VTIIPLAPPLLAGSSSLPGSCGRAVHWDIPAPVTAPGARAPLFGLAPCGVLPATRVATGAVRSYRTFSPLPAAALSSRGAASLATCRWLCIFCATFLQVALTGRYPAHCPSEFGLSSHPAPERRECGRSSGLLRRRPPSREPLILRPPPAKSRTARASCTNCCAACRSLPPSSKCSSCSRAACRRGTSAPPTP
jgi:hypothetical protein